MHSPGCLMFVNRRVKVQHRGYCLLQGWAHQVRGVPVLSFDAPKAAVWKTLGKLFKLALATFQGKEIHRNEKNRICWKPILNTAVPSNDKPQAGEGIARYTSTNLLFLENMNTDEKLEWRAA